MELKSPMKKDALHQIYRCMIITFIIGLLAHGYAFFQDSFSHDGLNALYAGAVEDTWMVALGRYLIPVYRNVFRGDIAVPWLIGGLTFVWFGMILYFLLRFFRIRSKAAVLLCAGIILTNRTITAWIATYIYMLDAVVFGILMAVIAAYLWKVHKRGFLWGIPFVFAAVGIYQSNISVVITLIMLSCILDLIEGISVADVLKRGISGACMILAGAVAYLLCGSLLQSLMGTDAAQSYNSLSNMSDASISVFHRLWMTYGKVALTFLRPVTIWHEAVVIGATVLLGAIVVIVAVKRMHMHRISFAALALAGVLVVLLPMGMNSAVFLMADGHDLMFFSVWFVYLFAVVVLETVLPKCGFGKQHIYKTIGTVLLVCILWNNVAVANTVYLKKDLEQEATLSTMTRVVEEMEEIPEYVSGETPVAFIGKRNDWKNEMPGFESFGEVTGAEYASPITGIKEANAFDTYLTYFRYVLHEPIVMCDEAVRLEFVTDSRVLEMQDFPHESSIQMLDGVLVVKMGNEW